MSVLPCDQTLRLEAGSMRDYRALSEHHYRSGAPCAPTAIYALRHDAPDAAARFRGAAPRPTLAGVLVMARPQLGCTLRDHATGGRYRGLKRSEAADLLNAEVRTIARVVLDPRYRGLGLAVRLVKHALIHAETPYVEALAAMGRVNPFFERAGMVRYEAPPRPADARLLDALTELNWPRTLLASPRLFAQRLGDLEPAQRAWIESELRRWHRSAAFVSRARLRTCMKAMGCGGQAMLWECGPRERAADDQSTSIDGTAIGVALRSQSLPPDHGTHPFTHVFVEAGLEEIIALARDRLLSRCVYYLHHDPQRGRR